MWFQLAASLQVLEVMFGWIQPVEETFLLGALSVFSFSVNSLLLSFKKLESRTVMSDALDRPYTVLKKFVVKKHENVKQKFFNDFFSCVRTCFLHHVTVAQVFVVVSLCLYFGVLYSLDNLNEEFILI